MRCYCEEPEVFRERIVKAPRKAHTCIECGYRMLAGHAHKYTYGVMDGSSYSARTCLACEAHRQWVEAHIPCVCWTIGDLLQHSIDICAEYADEADCSDLLSECEARVATRIADAKQGRASTAQASS